MIGQLDHFFHKDFKNETQVILTVLSHDQENDSDIIAIIATSAAITLAGLPFMGPVGATKVGMKDNKLILNPTLSELKESNLELVVAGHKARGANDRIRSSSTF